MLRTHGQVELEEGPLQCGLGLCTLLHVTTCGSEGKRPILEMGKLWPREGQGTAKGLASVPYPDP